MRTSETENFQLLIGALVALIMCTFLTQNSYAAVKPIVCKTNFGERSFTIDKHEVAFHQETEGRSISSVVESVTKKTQQGFNKTIYKDGSRHFIHIANESKFDSAEDFLAVTNPKGHKMTYPLNCSRVQ